MQKISIILILILLPILNIQLDCQSIVNVDTKQDSVRNIILIIGDGMGISQLTAGMYSNSNKLHLEEFKVIGLHKSYAFDNLITDSAAAATALSTGQKTCNGRISMSCEGEKIKTIVEEAAENGIKTGLIVSSTITHATPAAFYAHQLSRNMHKAIAKDLAKSDIDLFIGGGKEYFMDDSSSLIKNMEDSGFKIMDIYSGSIDETLNMNYDRLGIFTAEGSPSKVNEGRDYLESVVERGIHFLDQDNGFFLMVESSQIDWAGHDQDQEYLIAELMEFDKIIGKVLDYAKHDKNTLVIVTGDHETGALSLDYGSKMNDIICKFGSGGHTGDLIPVFAYGPGAESFGGIFENTALYNKMKCLFGFE